MLEIGTQIDGFRIDGFLGRGGMGVVYEATQVALGRPVALKVLSPELGSDPEFLERFQREGEHQASLEHAHVAQVYEAGTSSHGLYIAMRLVRGRTLAALLETGELPAERAVLLLGQVAEALDAAHRAGFVHRDVKPQNVLVEDSDAAYLADFGLTKVGDSTGATISSGIAGTVAYLAPEVIRAGPVSPAADRYAFAATLYECLAGEQLFPGRSDAAVLYAHTHEPAPRLSERRPGIPAAVDGVLGKALAKDPAERPASAAEIVAGVSRALGPTAARLPSPVAGARRVGPATTLAPGLPPRGGLLNPPRAVA